MQHIEDPTVNRWRLGLAVVIFTFWVLALNYARLFPFQQQCVYAGKSAQCLGSETPTLETVRTAVQSGALQAREAKQDLSSGPPVYLVASVVYSKVFHLADAEAPEKDYRLRSINVLFGVLMLVSTYRIARRYAKRSVSVLATIFAGMIPMYAATAGTINTNIAGGAMGAWAMSMLLAAAYRPTLSPRAWGIAGVSLGLAILTDTSNFSLVVAWLSVLILGKSINKASIVAFLIGSGLGTYTLFRNHDLTGNFLALGPQSGYGSVNVLSVFLRSFVGVFDGDTVHLPEIAYPVILMGLALCLVAGIISNLTPQEKEAIPVYPLLIWIGTGLAYFAVQFLAHESPHAVLLYPTLAGLAVLAALGVRRFNEKAMIPIVIATYLGFVILNSFAFRSIGETYSRIKLPALGAPK